MKTLIYFAILVTLIVGEVMCIVKFIRSDFEPSYKRELVYGIGVVTGFGAIIGYLDIPDTPPQVK